MTTGNIGLATFSSSSSGKLLEKETIINYNEAEPLASIYTHNKALINKLMRLMLSRPKDIRVVERFENGAIEFTVPKKWCKVVCPPTYTQAQKEKMAERMRAMREQTV